MDRVGLGSGGGIDDRCQWLVLDANQLGRPSRLLRVLRGDEGDGLAVVPHAVEGEHRLVPELEAVALVAGNVRVGENGVDTRHAEGGREIDRDHPGVRMRAAEGVAPEHAGREQVTRVRELAGHLRDAVHAPDAFSDPTELELAGRRAQSSTPATNGAPRARVFALGWNASRGRVGTRVTRA